MFKVLETGGDDGSTSLWMLLMPLNCTLKWLKSQILHYTFFTTVNFLKIKTSLLELALLGFGLAWRIPFFLSDSPFGMRKSVLCLFHHCIFFLFSFFCFRSIYYNWRLITLQYWVVFAIHWHESANFISI